MVKNCHTIFRWLLDGSKNGSLDLQLQIFLPAVLEATDLIMSKQTLRLREHFNELIEIAIKERVLDKITDQARSEGRFDVLSEIELRLQYPRPTFSEYPSSPSEDNKKYELLLGLIELEK